MAIRIEYLLFLMIVLLLVSIWGIHPKSLIAQSPKGDKEVIFQNFSLYDIKIDKPSEVVSASKMIKYKNYVVMDEIDLKEGRAYRLLSNQAVYEKNFVHMNKGVHILRDDGLKFSTESLDYNLKSKDIKTLKPFVLEFNSSIIKGENLALNMDSKEISADNINAKIVTQE